MNYTRDYLSFVVGIALSFVSDWFAELQIVVLQKIFYLLSITILFLALYRMVRKKKKDHDDFVDAIASTQKAVQIAELAYDPEIKSQKVLSIIQLIKTGGIKMKAKLFGLSKTQLLSFAATIILLVLGFLSATFEVPQLAIIADKIEFVFIAAGVTAVPGIFSKGKQLGDSVGKILPTKEKKEIQKKIKDLMKKLQALAQKYKPVIDSATEIAEFGGQLTPEEQILYNTYVTQKNTIESRITKEREKLGVQNNVEVL